MAGHMELLQKWLFDPVVGRIVTVCVGLIILQILLKFLHRSLEGRSRVPEFRYRLHKLIKMFRRSARDRLFSRILEEIAKTAGTITIASTTMEVTVAGSGGAGRKSNRGG